MDGESFNYSELIYIYIYIWMINLSTAIGLTPGGSSTVHIYTQTVHRTTQKKQYVHRTTQQFGRVRAVRRLG